MVSGSSWSMLRDERKDRLPDWIGCLRRRPWSCISEAFCRRDSGNSLKEHEDEDVNFGCRRDVYVEIVS